MLKNKMSHYVNEDTMKIYKNTCNLDLLIFEQDEQVFYNKISRILVFNFLKNEAHISTLTSRRMDKSKKYEHMRAER